MLNSLNHPHVTKYLHAACRGSELRIFMDWTFIEAYFQRGRAAITRSAALDENTTVALSSDANVTVTSARVYPMASIWASEAEVRAAPRVYT